MMGIDRIHTMLSKFGYGQSTGIDLNEEYNGLLPSRDWKMKVHKKPWYQGDTVSVGIGQGYWIATPIQMVKALVALINNGRVIAPHLLEKSQLGNHVQLYQPKLPQAQIGDPHSLTGRWCVTRCLAWLTRRMAQATSISTPRLMALLPRVERRRYSA